MSTTGRSTSGPVAHRVVQGECISSIAARYDFHDPIVLFEHALNAKLREKRDDPNVLLPGDVVMIPALDQRFEDATTGQMHKFVVKKPPPTMFRVVLADMQDKPFQNCPYELSVDGGPWVKGATDGEGLLETEVFPLAREVDVLVEVKVDNGKVTMTVPLCFELGAMNPVDDDDGVRERLHNLGYAWDYEGESVDDELDGDEVVDMMLGDIEQVHGSQSFTDDGQSDPADAGDGQSYAVDESYRFEDQRIEAMFADGTWEGEADDVSSGQADDAADDDHAREGLEVAAGEHQLDGQEPTASGDDGQAGAGASTGSQGQADAKAWDVRDLPTFAGAVARFQSDQGMGATGKLDDATRARLKRVHDGG